MNATTSPPSPHTKKHAGWAGTVFLGVFGGVFAAAGLGVLCFAFPQAIESGDGEARLASGLVGVLFTLVGLGIIWLAFYQRNAANETAQLRDRHPDAPWLWRSDWASGRIRGDGRTSAIFFTIFALFWNAISWPIVPKMVESWQRGETKVLIAALFPLVGLGLLFVAGRAIHRYRKFGRSTLLLETIPGVIGGYLRGRVQTRTRLMATRAQVTLRCIREITTGSGDNRSTREQILFEEKRDVDESGFHMGMYGSEIPIAFRIPFDCEPSDDENPRDEILWRVGVTAEVPGVDFGVNFVVPVFRTAESSPEITSAVDEGEIPEVVLSPEPTASLPGSKVRLRARPGGGIELHFGAARNLGAATDLTLFWLCWTGIVAVLWQSDAPLLFPIIFGGFDVLIGMAVVSLWFASARVRADASALEVRRALFGLGRTRVAPASEIEGIDLERGMQAGQTVYYDVYARRRGDGKIKLGSGVPDKRAAEAMVAALERALEIRATRGGWDDRDRG